MKKQGFYVICLAGALYLAGCGTLQRAFLETPSGAMSTAAKQRAAPGSWMAPTHSTQSLLYVTDSTANVFIYTYPGGQLVGTLTGFIMPQGECTDASGDVFIVAYSNQSFSASTIYEYAHGGTSPIATLSDPGRGVGCSFDATTGNVAIANISDDSNPYGLHGDVAVYPGGQSVPTMLYSDEFNFLLCGYDSAGNLYLSAEDAQYGNQARLVGLRSGSSDFEAMTVSAKIYMRSDFPASVQWDGRHITVTSASSQSEGGPTSVYRLRISGTNAKVVGTTILRSKTNHYGGQLWIQQKTIAGIVYRKGIARAASWRYPSGGGHATSVKLGSGLFFGVTVSPGTSQAAERQRG